MNHITSNSNDFYNFHCTGKLRRPHACESAPGLNKHRKNLNKLDGTPTTSSRNRCPPETFILCAAILRAFYVLVQQAGSTSQHVCAIMTYQGNPVSEKWKGWSIMPGTRVLKHVNSKTLQLRNHKTPSITLFSSVDIQNSTHFHFHIGKTSSLCFAFSSVWIESCPQWSKRELFFSPSKELAVPLSHPGTRDLSSQRCVGGLRFPYGAWW